MPDCKISAHIFIQHNILNTFIQHNNLNTWPVIRALHIVTCEWTHSMSAQVYKQQAFTHS